MPQTNKEAFILEGTEGVRMNEKAKQEELYLFQDIEYFHLIYDPRTQWYNFPFRMDRGRWRNKNMVKFTHPPTPWRLLTKQPGEPNPHLDRLTQIAQTGIID